MGMPSGMARPAALLDVDGTLVDSVYHHALTWWRALRRHDLYVPVCRVHRHIGMGGDQIVKALCGEAVEREHGDSLRELEGNLFSEVIDEIRPLPGACELLQALDQRGTEIVIASSSNQDDLDHYLDLLEARDLASGWTSSADVEATKPEPDVVLAALDQVEGDGGAVMVGDATWDALAAGRAEIPTIGVLTGGFCASELREAGADPVFDSPAELLDGLDSTPLR
jgi:phosphoglycolate phosphatase-like HAD superfamily hydrolase